MIIIAIFGCGGSTLHSVYPVKGIVTVAGKPAEGINVTFAPIDGRMASSGRTNSRGEFVLTSEKGKTGAVSGKHKVLLSIPAVSVDFSDMAAIERLAASRSASTKGGKSGALAKSKTPAEISEDYSNPKKTTFEFEVQSSSNNFEVLVP